MRPFLFRVFKKITRPFRGAGLGLMRIKFIAAVYYFFVSRLKPDFFEIDGIKMFLDKNDNLEFSVREYEPEIRKLFKNNIKKGFTIVDVGAHIGYHTLLSAQLVGPEGKVFAFEPNPENCSVLKRSIAVNGFQNIYLIEKAVADKAGKSKLFLSGVSNDNRLYDPGDGRQAIFIDTVSLDDFFRSKNETVDFIKMDIDGFEYAALKGARDLLLKSKNLTLLTEFCPLYIKQAGGDPKLFISDLRELGFEIYDVSNKRKVSVLADDKTLFSSYNLENGLYTNLFCVKK